MGTRFAFDLGTNSIGWAVWRTERDPAGIFGDDAPLELLGAGVRLFKDGRNPKDGQSLAAMRRVPKQARKRRDRFLLRRKELIRALIAVGLFPAEATERRALEALDPYQLRAKALDSALTPFEIGRAIFHLNQRRGFKSNRKADRPKKGGKPEEQGKIKAGAEKLDALMREGNCRTLGEFLWTRHRGQSHDPARPRSEGRQSTRIRMDGVGSKALYDFYPAREMVRHEFDLIWERQAAHHPALLTSEAHKAIGGILFRQRPLKKPKVGRCTFVDGEERLPKALPSVQAREIYERLNHLRLSTGLGVERSLSVTERDELATALLHSGLTKIKLGKDGLSFKREMRKALRLGSEVTINFEEGGETALSDLRTHRVLLQPSHFGPTWRKLSWARKDAFVLRLLNEADDHALIDWLMAEHRLSREAAGNCADMSLPDGHSRLGPTANAAILEALIDERDTDGGVIPYSEAVLRAGKTLGRDWHHSDIDIKSGMPAPIVANKLPYYGEVLQRHILPGSGALEDRDDAAAFWGRFPNPTVHIALNQLKRVVDRLIEEFDHPDQIVLELARELKQNAKQKEEEQKRNRENRDANEKRATKLEELKIPNDGEARARLKLFEEQQRAGKGVALCPFSGRTISVEKLFSSEIEIEHILPWSKTLDDSPANKVLCYRDMNRIKRSNAPYEAFGPHKTSEAEWAEIAARAESLPSNKRWRFRPDAMAQFEKGAAGGLSDEERRTMGLGKGFLARQLNETKYLSRLARGYLNHVCLRFDEKTGECVYGDVYVTTGALTGMLRGKWGLNSLLSDDNRKDRTDHRHHALDAIVIGAMTRGLLNELARKAGAAEDSGVGKILDKVDWPFREFRDAIRNRLDAIVISNKPEHGKRGALHEDTAYGLIRDAEEAKALGNLVRRKPLADLTPGEVDGIRDAALRKAVQESVAPFRDAKGKARDEKAFKAALAGFAIEKTVRRVRFGKEDASAVTIADRRTGQPYKAVAPGENHHIDIVQMRDGAWRGFAATVFEVNRKDFRPQWEREKLGGKLVMRLHKGDMVELEDKEGGRVIKVVIRIEPSQARLRLMPHNEGGDLQKRHDDPDDPLRWDLATISGLKARGCIALKVDAIGRIGARRTNV